MIKQSCYGNTLEFPFGSIILYHLSIYETIYSSKVGAMDTPVAYSTTILCSLAFMTLDILSKVGQ